MADTLGEIYRNSVAPSGLTNGEATLLTTNSNTSHVIKDVQVIQGDADIPITGALEINGYNIASASTNASGTAIMGPSSTLKLKSDFALEYEDIVLKAQGGSSNVRDLTIPLINGITGKASNIVNNVSVSGFQYSGNDSAFRQQWTQIGSSNNTLVITWDLNSSSYAYLQDSSGSNFWNNTDSYRPKWFDGERYVYWWENWNIRWRDCWSTGSQNYDASSSNTASYGQESTYPMLTGTQGENGSWILAWPQYNNNSYVPIMYDRYNNESMLLGSGGLTANQMLNAGNLFGLMHTGNNEFLILRYASSTQIHYWEWKKGTDFNTIPTYKTLVLDNSWQQAQSKAIIGTKLYYCDASRNVHVIDFSKDPITQTNLGQIHVTGTAYGSDLWGVKSTPSASTVSSRTYNTNPSVGLRITGVTST